MALVAAMLAVVVVMLAAARRMVDLQRQQSLTTTEAEATAVGAPQAVAVVAQDRLTASAATLRVV